MANTFYPKPTIGGSANVWGIYLDMLVRMGGQGTLTCELYNDSGVLKLSKGKIGISDGVVEGCAVIDTITTISTVGMTANNWHKIELSVSGTSVTISIAAIAGATDESTIDATTKAAYDYEKAGYYLAASKRLLGVVYLKTALALGRIVNCESGKFGFKEIKIINYYDSSGNLTNKYIAKIKQESGAWDMDANPSKTVSIRINIGLKNPECKKVMIIPDSGTDLYDLHYWNGGAEVFDGGYNYFTVVAGNTYISLGRRTGGIFDSVSFNDGIMNRAILDLEWET